MTSDQKQYINLSYKLKNQGKELGAQYDKNYKQWYITDVSLLPKFELVNLDVPYNFSDIAKDNGAMFFKETKEWKTSKFNLKRLEDILNNDMIKKLKTKQIEMLNDPTYKLMAEIEKMENIQKKYNTNK
jgi:hypothetical protein